MVYMRPKAMTKDAKRTEKLFDILSRLKETRVLAVKKAGYVRVKVLQFFFFWGGRGKVQRIPTLKCVEERIIAN